MRPAPGNQPESDVAKFCANIADAALDARVAWQQKELEAAEAKLRQRIAELEAKRAEYEQWLKLREDFLKKAEDNVVEIYSRMNPDAAAQQIASMADDTAAAVLAKLRARSASAILNEMEPARGAHLADTLAGMRRARRREDQEMKSHAVALCVRGVPGLSGCANNLADLNQAPLMSPIGQGLQADARAIPVERRGRFERKDLYRDPRATRVGDLLTVTISMNDKATLDNKTDRSRDFEDRRSAPTTSPSSCRGRRPGRLMETLNSQSSTKGAGKIDRTEEVKFSVAAAVVDVLPNGNLLISGSQEVRVNYEMRVLNVGGIVRPLDVTRNNTIAYEKVAEARISYGGRGRLMEVQQPGVGSPDLRSGRSILGKWRRLETDQISADEGTVT